MSRRVLLLCLCVANCTSSRRADLTATLDAVEALRAKRDLRGALTLADGALQKHPQRGEPYARLCVLKSQVLMDRDGMEAGLAFLESAPASTVPAGAYILKRQEALIEADLGRFQDAARHLAEAIPLAGAADNAQQVAGTEVTRSRILLKLDRPQEAQQSLDSAKRYSESSGDNSWDPYILQYSGGILAQSNQLEAALVPLQAAHAMFLERKKRQLAAKVDIDMASVYYQLGRLDKAQELYERAEPLVAAVDRHYCLGHLGNIFYDRGDLKQAALNFKKAAELARNQDKNYYSNWLAGLAVVLAEEGQWGTAAAFNQEAIAVAKSLPGALGLHFAMVTAGRIAAARQDYAGAEKQLWAVENLPSANPAAVLDAYAALAQVYAESGRPKDAERQFQTAMKLVDQRRTDLREDENKISYLASLIKLHRQYVTFQMARGNSAGAFQVSEMSRARVLRDRLNQHHGKVSSHEIADYQRAARESGATYLVYWVAPRRSFVWIIDGANFSAQPLCGEAQIRALVERHQKSVEGSRPDAGAAAALYDAVVPAGLAGKRFVIVPDGPLYGLNFETLRHGSRYWIQDATLAVAPSLELLLPPPAPKRATRNILLVGDAVQWTPDFPKLLNASKEMARIGHQFPDGLQTSLAGDRATPAAFMKSEPSKYSYVHFAAHAVANRNAPLDSAIILSQGRLSVRDVMATAVQAQLVTISACSSAGARTYSGEGLVGLAWAFLQSGAHGVVAGLWDVNDYVSPILMESLYAGLAAGEEPADALRAAKLKLLEPGSKYADPSYWGAFQLYLGGR